ncbi:MAG: protein kinase [Verrucomicrobiota bacterium]
MTRFFSLVLHGPDGARQTWRLAAGEYVLGTAEDCDLIVACDGVAPRHARVVLASDSFRVEDLSETKRCFVDGKEVNGGREGAYPAALQLGSAIFSLNVEKLVPEGEANGGGNREKEPPGVVDVRNSYTLLEQIGSGGMGAVFEAEDAHLNRTIAVKVGKRGGGGDYTRFFEEAEVMARLAHPNIVPVYNVGLNWNGQPAYSMKLLRGHTLQAILNGIRERDPEFFEVYSRERLLTIFLKVCDAIAFAHSKGVLHRDLKPENVMVGEFGEVLVVDWGLAKAFPDAKLSDVREQNECALLVMNVTAPPRWDETIDGDVLGTPQYMPPEQAAGRVAILDERSDIYSLGAILYAILTLHPPVDGDSVDEVLEKVKAGAIVSIQERLEAGAAARDELVGASQEELQSEALEAVVKKAMALSAGERYQSVLELQSEIHAFRSGFATVAERASFWRHLVLLMRRHRVESVMVAVFLVAVTFFLGKLAASERELRESVQIAVQQRSMAEWNAKAAKKNELDAVFNQQVALEEKEAANRASAEARIAVAEAAEYRMDGKAMFDALQEIPKELRGTHQSWKYMSDALDSSSLTVHSPDGSPFVGVFSRSGVGGKMLSVQSNGWVREVDLQSGFFSDVFRLSETERVMTAAISGDGKRLAVVLRCAEDEGSEDSIQIRSLPDGTLKGMISGVKSPYQMRLNRDGRYLVLEPKSSWKSWGESKFQIWNTERGKMEWEGGSVIDSVGEFVGDGRFRMLRADAPQAVGVFTDVNIATREVSSEVSAISSRVVPERLAGRSVYCINPQGNLLYGIRSGSLAKLDFKDYKVLYESRLEGRKELDVALLPRQKLLVTLAQTSDHSGVLEFWRESNGRPLTSMIWMAHGDASEWRLAVNPESGEVLTMDGDRLKVWRLNVLNAQHHSARLGAGSGVFLGDPRYYAQWKAEKGNSSEGRLEIFDLRQINPFESPVYVDPMGQGERISADYAGARLCLKAGGIIWAYEPAEEGWKRSGGWMSSFQGGAFRLSPNGMCLWLGGAFCDPLTGDVLARCDRSQFVSLGARRGVTWVNSHVLAEIVLVKNGAASREVGAGTRAIVLWDADTGAMLKIVAAPNANSLGVSSDGTQLVEGGLDKRIRIRPVDTMDIERELRVHGGAVSGAVWHPSKPLLFTTSEDMKVKVWDLSTGTLDRELGVVMYGAPEDISVSADARFLGLSFRGGSENAVFDIEAMESGAAHSGRGSGSMQRGR